MLRRAVFLVFNNPCQKMISTNSTMQGGTKFRVVNKMTRKLRSVCGLQSRYDKRQQRNAGKH